MLISPRYQCDTCLYEEDSTNDLDKWRQPKGWLQYISDESEYWKHACPSCAAILKTLRPCPHCGGEALISNSSKRTSVYIYCAVCRVRGPRKIDKSRVEAMKQAVEKWNNVCEWNKEKLKRKL